MSDIFAKLMTEERKQRDQVQGKKSRVIGDKVAQNTAQKVEQMSKPMSEEVSKANVAGEVVELLDVPTTEDIETMTFTLRKVQKTKVNTVIADKWKLQLDDIAYRLRVGKYELVEFIIGEFLGMVKRKK